MNAPLPSHPFLLQVAGLSHAFEVASFRGRERLSRPHVFDLRFVTARRVAEAQGSLLGRDATFSLRLASGDARHVGGVVVSQRVEGSAARGDRRLVCVRLASRVALLAQRRGSRVFQGMSAVAVAGTVLRGAGVDVAFALDRRYPLLDCCVQHRETDLAFVHRLLAEHGIAYRVSTALDGEGDADATRADLAGVTAFAEGPADGAPPPRESVTLFDRAERYPAGSLAAPFDPDETSGFGERVTRFSERAAVRPTRAAWRGFDFRRPDAPVDVSASTLDARGRAPGPVEALGLETYDHHADASTDDRDRGGARVAFERERSRALVCEGESNVRSLAPGARLALEGHPLHEFNRAYAAVEVAHEGSVPELARDGAPPGEAVYRNRFRCVPAGVLLRPPRAARPTAHVETATVVGPAGESVHTDEHGRVRVRFHWDRDAAGRTAWVRVAQQWAGQRFGAQFIPRVGSEVLVTFLDGDPDRPIVTGSVYNGAQPPPFALPEERGRSGWRTATIGAEGHSELSFDDAAGAEVLRVRAERDLEARVGRDHAREVLRDERADVHRDLHVNVRGEQRVTTAGDLHEDVGRDAVTRVGRDLRAHVEAALDETVGGDARRAVRGSERREVSGARDDEVRGDATSTVRGHAVTRVGDHDAPKTWALYADDRATLHATRELTLSADASITLTVGRSALRITPERIELVAPEVRLSSGHARVTLTEGEVRVAAGEQVTVRGRRVLARSEGAGVALSTEAAVDGAQVLLNSPASARDRVDDPHADPTRVSLSDERGRPMAGQHFVLRTDDGREYMGILGGDGRAEIDVPASGAVRFPGLRDVD